MKPSALIRPFLEFNVIGYLSKAAQIASGLLIVNRFAAEDLGLYFLYTSYAILMTKAGEFGWGRVNILLTAEDRADRSVFANILLVKFSISMAYVLVALIGHDRFSSFAMFAVVLAHYDVTGYYVVWSSNFDRKQQFRTKMLFDLLQNGTALAYIGIQTLAFKNTEVVPLVVGLLISRVMVLAAIVVYQRIVPDWRLWSRGKVKLILANGGNLFFLSLFTAVYFRIGFVLLPRLGVDMTSIGVYGKIARLLQDVAFVATQVGVYFFPRFVGDRSRDHLRHTLKLFMGIQTAMALLVVAALLVFRDFIVLRLLNLGGESSLVTSSLYLLVSLAVIVSYQNYSLVQYFVARANYAQPQMALLAAAACSIVANIVLIPQAGILGTAWATLLAEALAAVILALLIVRQITASNSEAEVRG